MYLPIFSKRHRKRLKSGDLSIDFSPFIKQRILYAMQDVDETWYEQTDTGLTYNVSHTDCLGGELCREHGWEHLKTFVKDKGMQKAAITEFIKGGAPQYIFDAIELYSKMLSETKYTFQEKVNQVFTDANLPWRLSNDVIFQVDSEYLSEVLSSASKLLTATGFQGARQEFQEARSHFDSGDCKGSIHHANLALESTMKAILGH